MKRIVFKLLLFALFTTGYAYAQPPKQDVKIRERIQKELNVNEQKADSTATILRQYFTKVRAIRQNEGMSDERKQLAIKKERRLNIAKLKTFLTADQLKKLRELVQQYKDMRQQSNQDDPADTSLSKYYF